MTSVNDDTTVISGVPGFDDPADPRDDSLATELAKAAPRRWWNRGTIVLGGVALLLGGFLGGLQAQKHWGTASATTAGARGATGFGGGQNRAGYGAAAGGYGAFGGGQAPGGGAVPGNGTAPGGAAAPTPAAAAGTTGTVKLVDGKTIYVQTADGSVVTVKTDGGTTVSAAAKGTLKDVRAGQTITVQGAAGTDGTVTATSVTTQKR